MNKHLVKISALGAIALAGAWQVPATAQEPAAKVEYIDIRWDGVDRMCVVYPDGHVDFVGQELKAIPRPDDANQRAFYMTLEMNRMAKLGYEFSGMISDEIVMKRPIAG